MSDPRYAPVVGREDSAQLYKLRSRLLFAHNPLHSLPFLHTHSTKATFSPSYARITRFTGVITVLVDERIFVTSFQAKDECMKDYVTARTHIHSPYTQPLRSSQRFAKNNYRHPKTLIYSKASHFHTPPFPPSKLGQSQTKFKPPKLPHHTPHS